jgi:hypothetical protein
MFITIGKFTGHKMPLYLFVLLLPALNGEDKRKYYYENNKKGNFCCKGHKSGGASYAQKIDQLKSRIQLLSLFRGLG